MARVAPRLLGPALMVAAAIIVKGYTDAGDGFSAGVIVTLAIAVRYVALVFSTCRADAPHHAERARDRRMWLVDRVGLRVLRAVGRRAALHPLSASG